MQCNNPCSATTPDETCCTHHHRPDGKVAYGFSLFRGKRSNMEDFHHAQVSRFSNACMPSLFQAIFVCSRLTNVVVLGPRGSKLLQLAVYPVTCWRLLLQFKTEPKSGEVVGLFGVFDGK